MNANTMVQPVGLEGMVDLPNGKALRFAFNVGAAYAAYNSDNIGFLQGVHNAPDGGGVAACAFGKQLTGYFYVLLIFVNKNQAVQCNRTFCI